jgi:hypothetical protein
MPIKRLFFFPTEAQIKAGCLLKNVSPICIDNENALIVADWLYCSIYRFSASGQLLNFFGKKGQGPGEYEYINQIFPFNNGLAIMDSGNMRINIVDKTGQLTKSFRIFKTYSGIASAPNQSVFYLPPLNTEPHLIDIVNIEGQLVGKLGEKIHFKNSHPSLNSVFIQSNSAGDVWAAWRYFPVIKRYDSKGRLLADLRINDNALDDQVKANESVAESRAAGNKIATYGIINGFFLTERSLFVLLYGKDVRPRIIEYGYEGEQLNVYEIMDDVEKVIYMNLVVTSVKDKKEKYFYLLQAFPEARVDVYGIY